MPRHSFKPRNADGAGRVPPSYVPAGGAYDADRGDVGRIAAGRRVAPHMRRAITFISSVLVLGFIGWMVLGGWSDVTEPLIEDAMHPGVDASGSARVVVVGGAPASLDLAHTDDSAIRQVLIGNVHEGVTRLGPDGSVKPGVAESWETDESTHTYWTFHIRKGLRFSNGDRLTAESVVNSLHRLVQDDLPGLGELKGRMNTVYAPDAYTVRITLDKPMAALPYLLAGQAGIVYDLGPDLKAEGPEGAAKDGKVEAAGIVSSGPYVVKGYSDGRLTLAANPKYSGDASPKAGTVTVSWASAADAAKSLADGAADYVVSDSAVPGLTADTDKAKVARGNGTRRTVIAFNTRADRPYPALSDRRFRQGVRMMLDKNALIAQLPDHDGMIALGGPTVPGTFGYEDLTGLFPYDWARGRSTATSYFGIYRMDVIYRASLGTGLGDVITADLGQADQYTTMEPLDDATYQQRLDNRDFDAAVLDITGMDGMAGLLDGNGLTGLNAPDVTTAYDAIWTAATDEDLANAVRNAARVQSDWSTVDWIGAHRTTLASVRNAPGAPSADLIDVRLPLYSIGPVSGR